MGYGPVALQDFRNPWMQGLGSHMGKVLWPTGQSLCGAPVPPYTQMHRDQGRKWRQTDYLLRNLSPTNSNLQVLKIKMRNKESLSIKSQYQSSASTQQVSQVGRASTLWDSQCLASIHAASPKVRWRCSRSKHWQWSQNPGVQLTPPFSEFPLQLHTLLPGDLPPEQHPTWGCPRHDINS